MKCGFSFSIGWPSTVKLLLDSNADINTVNIGGKTALMMAVEYEHEDVLTVLSKHKTVQLDIADSEGYPTEILEECFLFLYLNLYDLQLYGPTPSS